MLRSIPTCVSLFSIRQVRRRGSHPVAVIVAAGLIWQSSYATFSGTTRNSGNDWATGWVILSDDDAGASRFQDGSMTPGATGTQYLKITADASVPGTVKGYAHGYRLPVATAQQLMPSLLPLTNAGTGSWEARGSADTCWPGPTSPSC